MSVNECGTGPVNDSDTATHRQEPFENFFRREYRSVLAIATALTRKRTDAEELTMEAFESALRLWDRNDLRNPSAWVRTVVSNKAVSRYRRAVTEAKALVQIAASGDKQSTIDTDSIEVWTAVRRLPARQAQAIVLFHVAGYSRLEIANLLGVGEETVKTHLDRGRARLAKALEVPE